MQMPAILAALLLASAPGGLAAALVRAGGGFLSPSGGIQPNLVAKNFAKIEDDWRSQAGVSVLCESQGASGDAAEKCQRNSKLFQKSCSTIANWLVQSNGESPQKVKAFMDGVCTNQDLNDQQQERCQDLKAAVLGAMASEGEHTGSFRPDGPCQSFWSALVEKERAHLAREERQPTKAQSAVAVGKDTVAADATERSGEDQGDTAEDDEAEDDDDDAAEEEDAAEDESGSGAAVAAAPAKPAAPAAPPTPSASAAPVSPAGQKEGAIAALAHQGHEEKEETEEEGTEGAETKTGAAPAQEGTEHRESEDGEAEQSGEVTAAAHSDDAAAATGSDSEEDDA